MTVRAGGWLQAAAFTGGIVAYALLCHHVNAAGDAPGFGAALALAPLLGTAGLLALKYLHPATAALLALLAGGALCAAWPLLERHFAEVFLLQECGFFGLLCASFAGSLRAGAVAMCTLFADRVHGPLSPAEIRYTRRATAAWALFFAAIALVDLTMYVMVPLRVWSLFVNFCTLPLVLLMFAGEYLVRRRVLPDTRGAGLVATLRLYFARAA